MKDPFVISSVLDAALECGYKMVGKLSANTSGTPDA